MNLNEYKLIICVFGCVTIEKYKKQIEKINETWGKECINDIKILFFLGEELCSEFKDNNKYIYLPNVNNDYLSASYKQMGGFKYIINNYKFKFVLCCGSDTFLNVPKLSLLLDKYNSNDNLYIGGHGCNRQIGDTNYYFHSGGPGFILTKESLFKLNPILDNIMDDWKLLCVKNNIQYLLASCDVSISYFLQKYCNVKIIILNDYSFLFCNYKGLPCHPNQVKYHNIISCHLMSLNDFDDFYKIIVNNNYFLS